MNSEVPLKKADEESTVKALKNNLLKTEVVQPSGLKGFV